MNLNGLAPEASPEPDTVDLWETLIRLIEPALFRVTPFLGRDGYTVEGPDTAPGPDGRLVSTLTARLPDVPNAPATLTVELTADDTDGFTVTVQPATTAESRRLPKPSDMRSDAQAESEARTWLDTALARAAWNLVCGL